MLTIPRISAAARALQSEQKDVTTGALSRILGCTASQVEYTVRALGISKKIGLLSDGKFPGLVYAQAADALRQRGIEFITRAILAKELKRREHAVRQTLLRHPDRVRVLRIISEGERRRIARRKAYENTRDEMRETNRRASIVAIARDAGVNRSIVHSDLRKDPKLREVLSTPETVE